MVVDVDAKKIARWAVLLPGAVLAAVLALFPLHWFIMLGSAFGRPAEDEGELSVWLIPPERLEQFGTALLVPAVIIRAGAWIAPSRKRQAAVILAGLVGAGIAFMYGWVIASPDQRLEGPLVLSILPAVLNLVGIVVGLKWAEAEPHH